MYKTARHYFNEQFTVGKYRALLNDVEKEYPGQLGFRLSETPVFIDRDFVDKVNDASQSILGQLNGFTMEDLQKGVPPHSHVPNVTERPHFLVIDYGICEGSNGGLEPQLIEFQGFTSLFGYQHFIEKMYQKHYDIPINIAKPSSVDSELFHKTLHDIIIGDEDPKNVVLLEVRPETQKTKIDYAIISRMLGIEVLCISHIIKEGRVLYYSKNGEKIKIKRIYNRIIFDDIERNPIDSQFQLTDDVDVQWVGHPNWYFMYSKFLLPRLKHRFIPNSFFVNEVIDQNLDLREYVLKPLYSFAGTGVDLNPTWEALKQLQKPENYILQQKVKYASVFEDVNGNQAKAEMRQLYAWPDNAPEPIHLVSLARMTKGEMINVSHSGKDNQWTGGSAVFVEG